MEIEGENFVLKKGSYMKFMANRNHTYKNTSKERSVFQNIIIYNK